MRALVHDRYGLPEGLRLESYGRSTHISRRVMKDRIGKLGEEFPIEIVGKGLPIDWSGP